MKPDNDKQPPKHGRWRTAEERRAAGVSRFTAIGLYAEEWIGRYQGNGRRGFTENTRDDYRRDLNRYMYPFFHERLDRTVSSVPVHGTLPTGSHGSVTRTSRADGLPTPLSDGSSAHFDLVSRPPDGKA